MKLAVIGRLGAGSILADENGNEVAFTVTEGSTANGGSFIDAPDMAKISPSKYSCFISEFLSIPRYSSSEIYGMACGCINFSFYNLENVSRK